MTDAGRSATVSTPEPLAPASALRLVSFIPPERDAVRVGLLSPDAQEVVDLAPLGIADALDALAQLDMLRRAAGAIMHGAARSAFSIRTVHLVAPIPLARSVTPLPGEASPHFADPVTLHGPGSALARDDAAAARPGLAAVVGSTLEARSDCDDATLDAALVGTLLILGWSQTAHSDRQVLLPGAVGPYIAVPRRNPESLVITRVSPLSATAAPDSKRSLPAPDRGAFHAVARAAVRSHTLRAGDLLVIFPEDVGAQHGPPMPPGSWVRVSAPGLGTLSLAVR